MYENLKTTCLDTSGDDGEIDDYNVQDGFPFIYPGSSSM